MEGARPADPHAPDYRYDRRVAVVEARVDAELKAAAEFARNSPEPSVEEFLSGWRFMTNHPTPAVHAERA